MLFTALSQFSVIAAPLLAAAEAGSLSNAGPWRPSEWAQPAVTAITIPSTSGPGSTPNQVGDLFSQISPAPSAPPYQGTPAQMLVFDAVLRVEHSREIRKTEHPIQTSASSPVATISDHAYLLPARVTLEIGMSDAMDSYSPGAWSSNPSKSVSAYQTLLGLLKSRTLVSLQTRLDSYQNMIVESIAPTDDNKTRHGLRATVRLSEVFLADVTAVSSSFKPTAATDDTAQPLSSRPQATDSTPSGTLQTSVVSSTLTQQHTVPSSDVQDVPGAGNWSSQNVSNLGGLL